MEKELTRETVDPRYTWDLTRIYASDEAWEEAFADVKAQAEAFAKRAGTLSQDAKSTFTAGRGSLSRRRPARSWSRSCWRLKRAKSRR